MMIKTAKGITDAEVEQAAAYFSGLKPRAAIKVVEHPLCRRPVLPDGFWRLCRAARLNLTPAALSRFPRIWSALRCAMRDAR